MARKNKEIFLVFVCLCFWTLAEAATIHQSRLGYLPPLKERLYQKGQLKEYLLTKSSVKSIKAAATQNIVDYEDMAYFTFITLGTPGQVFKAFIDTGSATLWVPDSSCLNGTVEECGDFCQLVPVERCTDFCLEKCCTKTNRRANVMRADGNGCASKSRFDSSKSSTYEADGTRFSITYQTGTVTGFLGTDTICMSTLCIRSQTFGQVMRIGGGFVQMPFDGILGLAYPSLAYNHLTPPIFNAINQGLLDQALFTVYMGHSGPTLKTNGGAITYGGIDRTNCAEQVDYVAVISQTYFMFQMSGVAAGSFSTQGKAWNTVSLTSAAYIGGPPTVVENLAKAVGAVYNAQYESYFIDCDANSPDLSFTINGKKFNVTSSNYIISVGAGPCMFAMFGVDGGGFMPTWLLGPPLIREYCQIYDIGNQRLGFAKTLTR